MVPPCAKERCFPLVEKGSRGSCGVVLVQNVVSGICEDFLGMRRPAQMCSRRHLRFLSRVGCR